MQLREAFELVAAVDIGFDRLTEYVRDRLKTGVARSTVLYELRLLHRAFVLAHRAGKVAQVPPFPTVTVSNARKIFATQSEIDRIVRHLPDDVKPAVQVLAWLGWRAREVLGIRWADVDRATLTIKRVAEHSKNKRPRFFPYGSLAPLAALLEERHGRTKARQRELGHVIPTAFWRTSNGGPLTYTVFRAAWRKAAEQAKLAHLRPHDLRRAAARALVRAGVNERVVMALLGWETPAMLQRYDIVATRDLAEGVGRLGAYLGESRPQNEHQIVTGTDGARLAAAAEGVALARKEDGATPQNRTGDTVIFSHVLYQLS